jgi:transposase InsO family protein
MTAALHLAQGYEQATPPTPAEGSPDPRKFAPIGEAADTLGLSRSMIQRRCRDQWKPAGLAVLAVPPEGGSPTWFVSRRADPRLALILGDEYQEPDLSIFTQTQQREARQKVQCVNAYRELRDTEKRPQGQWLGALAKRLSEQFPDLKVSGRSIRRWYAQYQRPVDILNLISARGGDQLRGATPEAWKFFESIFLDERKPSVKLCWRRTRDEAKINKWRWTSYEQCRRQLDDRIPPQTQAQFRSPREWRWNFRPFIEQDPESRQAGLCWIGDHAQLDMLCYLGDKLLRPWVTAWMDWRTRKIVGYCLSASPDSSTILAALRHGLLDESNLGGPDEVHIDNGKDYDSYTFHGKTKKQRKQRISDEVHADETLAHSTLGLLGIEAHFSIPHNPNGKSRLERWFLTMHDQFDKTFKTYCGCSPQDKPEGLNAILKDPHRIPTFDQVLSRFDDYVKGYNADADHSREDMKGLSPNEALEAWCPRKKVMADGPALLFCLQHWHQPVSVGRNGVTIKPRGRSISYGQFEPALIPYKGRRGKKVTVSYDPNDLRTIRVWDDAGRFVVAARMNQLGGMSTGDAIGREQVSELIRAQRRYKEAKRIVARNAHHEYLSPQEILAAGLTDTPKKPKRERPLKIQQTPLDGQSDRVDTGLVRQTGDGKKTKRHVFTYKPKPRDDDDTYRGMPDVTTFLGKSCFKPRTDPDEYDPGEAMRLLLGDDPLSALRADSEDTDGPFVPCKISGGNAG